MQLLKGTAVTASGVNFELLEDAEVAGDEATYRAVQALVAEFEVDLGLDREARSEVRLKRFWHPSRWVSREFFQALRKAPYFFGLNIVDALVGGYLRLEGVVLRFQRRVLRSQLEKIAIERVRREQMLNPVKHDDVLFGEQHSSRMLDKDRRPMSAVELTIHNCRFGT